MPKVKDIFNVNLLKISSSRKSDLISKLDDLHKALTELSQDPLDRPLQLKEIASSLISQKILGSSDREIRLLAACCMVDILRVFAPDAPITDEETVSLFEVIVNLLRGLANHDTTSATGSKLFYILCSLSTIKSCVVPVILSQSNVSGASEVVVSMLDTLISSIRPTHNEEVLGHINNIVQSCIEETDEIDQEILDIILQPLLPSSKSENPIAYKVISNVVRSCANNIQNSFCNFVNSILIGTNNISNGKSSELVEHIYPLLYEVHKICPPLLIKVIPSICVQLQVDEDEIRLKATKLLGLLFASTFAEYGQECSRNFREFLGRFNDKSVSIRIEMVESGIVMMKKKPELRKIVEDVMIKSMKDGELEVRMKSIQGLLEVALDDPLNFTFSIYEEFGQRLIDKKFEIRKLTMIALARIYQRYISSTLPPLNEVEELGGYEDIVNVVNTDHWIRLKNIPSLLVKCWGYQDMQTRHLVIQLLQECILPKALNLSQESDEIEAISKRRISSSSSSSSSTSLTTTMVDPTLESRRATALYVMFQSLDMNGRQSFAAIMAFKTKARSECQLFIKCRQALLNNKVTGNDTTVEMASFRRSMINLSQLIPTPDKKTSIFDNLHQMKDKIIFRRLESMISSHELVATLLSNREDLKHRLDSKSSLGEYVGCLYDFSSYLISNEAVVSILLIYLQNMIQRFSRINIHKADQRSRKTGPKSVERESLRSNIESIGDLLLLLSKHTSQAYQRLTPLFISWLDIICDRSDNSSEDIELSSDQIYQLETYYRVVDLAASSFSLSSPLPDMNMSDSLRLDTMELSHKLLSLSMKITNEDICSKLSNAASRILVNLFQDNISKEITTSTYDSIKTELSMLHPSNLSTNDISRLGCNLAVLNSLANVPLPNATSIKSPKHSVLLSVMSPKQYTKFRKETFSLLKDIILVDSFIKDHQDDQIIQAVKVIISAVKLYSAIISAEVEVINTYPDQFKWIGNTIQVHVDLENLIQELFNTLESNGNEIFGITSLPNDTIKSMVNETVALIVFELLRVSNVGNRISISQWHRLGWTLLNENFEIRQRLFDAVSIILQTHNVPPQYLAYPCLLANDEKLRVRAESVFLFAVKRLRSTHAELCGRALAEDNDDLRKIAEEHIPEVILPYVMHLISYHPEFPSSATIETDEDKRRVGHVVKSLKMVLRVLLQSVESQTENISYLLKQVTVIEQRYEDKHDPDNIGIHFVARITLKLLKECIKTAENVQVYPGDIYLPNGLYQLKENKIMIPLTENENDVITIFSPTQMDQILESDHAIDNALNKIGKKIGKSTKLIVKSPSKSFVQSLKTKAKRKRVGKEGIERFSGHDNEDEGEDNNEDREEDDDDDDEDLIMKKSKKTVIVPKSLSKSLAAEDFSTRRSNRLKTNSLDSKAYVDRDEDEEEVLEWERSAANVQNVKNITKSKINKLTSVIEEKDENDEDKDDNDDQIFKTTQKKKELLENQKSKWKASEVFPSKLESKKRALNTIDTNISEPTDRKQLKMSSFLQSKQSVGESSVDMKISEEKPSLKDILEETNSRASKRLKPMRH